MKVQLNGKELRGELEIGVKALKKIEKNHFTQPDMCPELIESIKKGQICVDASYLDLNASICATRKCSTFSASHVRCNG